MKRPPKSERVRQAQRTRNHNTFRWIIVGICGLLGIGLGLFVLLQLQAMEPPRSRSGGLDFFGLHEWWYRFGMDWRFVLASATAGIAGVLLPVLSWPSRRKEVTTWVLSASIGVLLIWGVSFSMKTHAPLMEIILPAFLGALITASIVGCDPVSDPDGKEAWDKRRKKSPLVESGMAEGATPLPWRLAYGSTLEEFTDDCMTLERPPSVLRAHRIVGAACILLVAVLFFFLLPRKLPYKLPVLGSATAIFLIIRWKRHDARSRREIQDTLRKAPDLCFPFEAEWELREETLSYRRKGMQRIFSLDILQTLLVRDGCLLVGFGRSGHGILPRRAFSGLTERRLWHSRLAEHLPADGPARDPAAV